LRITFVLPFAGLSGGIRVVATYARKLTEQGHDVWVVSQPRRMPRWSQKLKAFWTWRAAENIKWTKTPLLDFLGDQHIVLDSWRPVTTADLPDADAVIATWWNTALPVAKLPNSKGRKFYFIQGYEVFDYLHVDEVVASYALPLTKITISNYIRDQIAEHHGITGVSVVPNAVDTDQFNRPKRHKNDRLTVGFLFNPHPVKRVELAIEALTRARAQVSSLRVIAFGSTPSGGRVVLPDWVEYHLSPEQADIPNLYGSCDLWLFTSQAEGFGLPLLEAMACRTPVLATCAGAAPDLVTGQNGKLLKPDADAFAIEIAAFAAMANAEWQCWSSAAHQTAHSYGWNEATDLLLETLRKAGQNQEGV
jgi:glycosyltransferase involved in cell wall biosynthesis